MMLYVFPRALPTHTATSVQYCTVLQYVYTTFRRTFVCKYKYKKYNSRLEHRLNRQKFQRSGFITGDTTA
jgi:hypothetical protein